MRVLQTHALPLGYRAKLSCTAFFPAHQNKNPPASFLVVGRFLV